MSKTVESLIKGIPTERLREEIAALKAKRKKITITIDRLELILSWQAESSSSGDVPSASAEASSASQAKAAGEGSATELSLEKLSAPAAVRHVVRMKPRPHWAPSDVVHELDLQGVEIDPRTVQVAMSRMAHAGEFDKAGKGQYVPKVSEGTPESPSMFPDGGGESNS